MGSAAEPRRIEWARLIRVFRVYGRHYRPYWKQLAIAGLGLLGAVAMSLLSPWPLALMIDHVIRHEPVPQALAFLLPWLERSPSQALAALAVAYVAIKVAESIFSYLDKYLTSTVGERMTADIRSRIFAHLQRLSLSFHKGAESGDVIYRMTSDVKDIKKLLINFPQDAIQSLVAICGFGGVMLWYHWRLGLLAISFLPLLYLLVHRTGLGVERAQKKKRKKEGKVAHIVGENVKALALVQAYGREASERSSFEQENRASLRADLRTVRLASGFKRLVDLLVAASTAGVLYLGGRAVLEGSLSFGTLYVFYKYVDELYGPIDKLAAALVDLAKQQVAGARTLELVENDMVMRDRPGARPAPRFEGRVEFRNVSFAYRKGESVLKGVDLVAEPGQTVAIVGPSGAGKSTLITLLLRFYDPTQGEIRIDGSDIRSFRLKSLRSRITILQQEALLFRKTIRENIAFGRPEATDAEIAAAAEQAQAHEFITSLPQGYDTVVSEGGRNLSGGQRQRLSIARAIVRDAPILVLDEPATGLDAESEARVREALKQLTRGRTTFVVAHKLATIRDADKILLLEDGVVAREGTHDELLASSPAYRELYELQMGRPTAA
jgi:ABC-type multidrug transport system fused ATPase/permease subunit